jgi:hypothetical protein
MLKNLLSIWHNLIEQGYGVVPENLANDFQNDTSGKNACY